MSRVARLGAFIVVALVILSAGVFIIGSKNYLFGSTYQLKAQFDNVAGLTNGADVQVGGVHSGTVTRIDLPTKPGDKVTVVVSVAKSTHEIIKQDSVATIETEGLLGNQFLAISFGTAGQAEVRDGDTIQSLPPMQMGELLKKASSILDSGQQAVQFVSQAAGHLNSVTAKIDSGDGTVGALVNDKEIYNNLNQTMITLHSTMLQAQNGVTDFQENMEALKHNFLLSGYFKKRGYEDSAALAANKISGLPMGTPVKAFIYTTKQLFVTRDSAKLLNQKSLTEAGDYLAQNAFGIAVVVTTAGTEGDTKADMVLTEARAMVVREYLVENFGFDDSQLKTLGMGKQIGPNLDSEWGTIQILVFPTGTTIPVNKLTSISGLPTSESAKPVQVTTAATLQP